MPVNPPQLDREYVCIVDRRASELAAVISSYLTKKGIYLPLFAMPGVTTSANTPMPKTMDEHSMSRDRATETALTIQNAITRLRGCDYVILAGLSPDQESYLQLPEAAQVIRIDKLDEIDFYLPGFFSTAKEKLACRPEELLKGLYAALQSDCWLEIRDNASPIEDFTKSSENCVVIENEATASAVLAVNYANAVQSDIIIVDPLVKGEAKEVLHLLEDWKIRKDKGAEAELQDKTMKRVGTVNFPAYDSVTFFTAGLPYSLVLGNPVPCCYVHLLWRPDHFVFNNILMARRPTIGAGIVFSPQSFEWEEINEVTSQMKKWDYYVKELVGKNATVYNLSRSIEYYPYDLLHICSHGGETHGTRLEKKFTDSQGTTHTVVYDSVLSFAGTPVMRNGEPLIEVTDMQFPRSFNGYKWHSPEWEAQNYPHFIFAEMYTAINKRDKSEKILEKIEQVPNSRSIMCKDFAYAGLIRQLAGNTHPVIFNNTCWSWGPISEHFLYAGARGYVGTLWDINNNVAVDCANSFYQIVPTKPVIEALHAAGSLAKGTGSQDIYVFYGLPFTRLYVPGGSK